MGRLQFKRQPCDGEALLMGSDGDDFCVKNKIVKDLRSFTENGKSKILISFADGSAISVMGASFSDIRKIPK